MIKIESLQNEKIKQVVKLRKANARKKNDLIIIEGKKELDLALESGWKIEELFYCPSLAPSIHLNIHFNVYEVTEEVFAKISYRDKGDGFLALAKPVNQELKSIEISKDPLVLVLENVEKPGNLGAILRTADASGVDLVILNNQQTDIYNPNVIRASRGTVFTVPVVSLSIDETVQFLKKNKITSYAAYLGADKIYTDINLKKASAVILGTEDKGLSKDWLDKVDQKIIIPMNGKIDSLNVSVSAAIIIYEALRQRSC